MKNAEILQKVYLIIHFSMFIQLAILLIIIISVALLILFLCKTKADDLVMEEDNDLIDNIEKQKKKCSIESKIFILIILLCKTLIFLKNNYKKLIKFYFL